MRDVLAVQDAVHSQGQRLPSQQSLQVSAAYSLSMLTCTLARYISSML